MGRRWVQEEKLNVGRCGKEKRTTDILNYLKEDLFGDVLGEDTQKRNKLKGF